MDIMTIGAVNFGFCWLIVALSATGYVLTLKRTGERWPLWIVLAIGWAFLAIPNTLITVGVRLSRAQLVALVLSSYILVMASLVLLFLKLLAIMKRQGTH